MSQPSNAPRFDPATDPTVAKLTRQINRSAGQHKRALSEGAANAQANLHRVPMTSDPLKLDDGIPVLRMVHSPHERQVVEPVPFSPAASQKQKQLKAWHESQARQQAEAQSQAHEKEPSGSGIAIAIVLAIVAVVGALSVVSSAGGADDALRVLSAAFR